MSFFSRFRNRVDEAVGDFKESAGQAYGNEALELDGEAEHDAAQEREEADEAAERAEHDVRRRTEDR